MFLHVAAGSELVSLLNGDGCSTLSTCQYCMSIGNKYLPQRQLTANTVLYINQVRLSHISDQRALEEIPNSLFTREH